MISKKNLLELHKRVDNSMALIDKNLQIEDLERNDFLILKKLREHNALYNVFVAELLNKEEKRYVVDEEYLAIIMEHCDFIENIFGEDS